MKHFFPFLLEGQAKAKTEGTLGLIGGGDAHEVSRRGYRHVGVLQLGRVRHVQTFGPELQVDFLRDIEGAEDAAVHVEEPGSTEVVEAHVAKAGTGDRREGGRVVVGRPKADSAQLTGRADLVRHLDVAGSVERGTVGQNRERVARYGRDRGVNLPAAQDLACGASGEHRLTLTKGQFIGDSSLEDLVAIKGRQSAVFAELRGHIEGKVVVGVTASLAEAVGVVRAAGDRGDGLRPGVRHGQEQTTLEAAAQVALQAVFAF